jgi:hypothetical protein
MAFDFSVPALRTPRRALTELREAIVPRGIPPDAVMELVIRTDQHDINIRELSAYLDFIDRTYGRLTRATDKLGSYSAIDLIAEYDGGHTIAFRTPLRDAIFLVKAPPVRRPELVYDWEWASK